MQMVETKFGNFEIVKNERDAFDLVKFEDKYLPEYFDKYPFIVGDLADDILRLKGFSYDNKASNYFHNIPEYLVEGCSYNCKYYILKRIKDNNQQLEENIVTEEQTENKPKKKKFKYYKKFKNKKVE